MNPSDWRDASRRVRVDPYHQVVVNNSTRNTSGTNRDWDAYHKYTTRTVHISQNELLGVDLGSQALSAPSDSFSTKESEEEDPDGEPYEMDPEDPELIRKRKELEAIEERIKQKKVSIALKTVTPFLKQLSPSGSASNDPSFVHEGPTLKERVNAILQKRHHFNFPSKSPKGSSSREGCLLQDDHPLKLRVKALMRQRSTSPCHVPAAMKIPDVTLPSPSQSLTSPAKTNVSINRGFERFLSVLNKGVDVELLSRIVNDDSEDFDMELPKLQPLPVQNHSDPSVRSQSPPSKSGPSLPSQKQTDSNSGESSVSNHLPDSDKKERKKEEEAATAKMDEQSVQLQNILKTLGLTLEVEEMNKLTDRTQERLYGKRQEGVSASSKGEQQSQQKGSPTHGRKSSSSSSSSSSTSRSASRSPSRRRGSKERQASKHSRSRDRSRSRSVETKRHRDADIDSNTISPYQHPYQLDQMYPPPNCSAFPEYSVPQYSQHSDYHSGFYSTTPNSSWTYAQEAIPPSSLYPSQSQYPQHPQHHFPNFAVAPKHENLRDVNLLLNPDLSKSEGQTGSASGRRCLQVIPTKQLTPRNCLKSLTQSRKVRKKKPTPQRRRRYRLRKIRRATAEKAASTATTAAKVETPQEGESEGDDSLDSAAQESEEEEHQPTEEEIKANLRKKLEAFNQKMKQKPPPPAPSLTPLTSLTD
ncbi:uncharacterized protein V6R79_017619 [Siganus canaliculatus]